MTARILILGAVLTLSASAADWPQLLGPNRDSTSTEKAIPSDWQKSPPATLWQRDVGAGYGGPVVAGGKVVLFHRVADKETVEALDAKTGKGLWKFDYATDYRDPYGKGDGPRSTPTVAGDKVFTLGPSGVLTCLEMATGKKTWQRDLAKDFTLRPSFFGVGSSPLVEGDLVVLNVGDKQAGIVAWNKETGKEVWRATDQEASYASGVAVTLDGKRRLIFFTREGIVGLDLAGKVVFDKRWRPRITASVNAASPIVVGDLLFVTTSYDTGAIVHRIEKDTLKPLWNNDESLTCQYSTPVVVEGKLYGFHGREDIGKAELRCVDLATGKVHWSAEDYGCGSIISVGKVLLLLTQDGRLEVIEANADKRVVLGSKKVLTGPVRAHLALSDGVIFVRDNQKLLALGWKE